MTHARYEHLWERLLAYLNEWSSAREVGAGRIRVELPTGDGSTRVVEVVMSEDEWDEMVSVAFGGFGPSVKEHVKERVTGLRPEQPFLVYLQYDLVPSTAESLPTDDEAERLAEQAREHPEGFGR